MLLRWILWSPLYSLKSSSRFEWSGEMADRTTANLFSSSTVVLFAATMGHPVFGVGDVDRLQFA